MKKGRGGRKEREAPTHLHLIEISELIPIVHSCVHFFTCGEFEN